MIVRKRDFSNCNYSVKTLLPVRGLMAIDIVLVHAIQFRGQPVGEVLSDFKWTATPFVAIFFFMSGYGLIYSLKTKGRRYLDDFLQRKLLRIVLPFALWSILYTVVMGGVNYSVESWKINYPFLPTGWFVISIIIYYVAFYISAKISKTPGMVLVLLAIFTLAYIYLMRRYNWYDYWWVTTLGINSGMVIAYYEEQMNRILEKYRKLIVTILFFTWIVTVILDILIGNRILNWPIASLIRYFFTGMLFWIIMKSIRIPENSIIDKFGTISYEIYIVQGAIEVFFVRYLSDYGILYFISVVFVTLLMAYMTKLVCVKNY